MIATFYAPAGAHGRSHCASATAIALSSWGHRTLCVDWHPDGELSTRLLAGRGPAQGVDLDTMVDGLINGEATTHTTTIRSPASGSARLDLIAARPLGAPDRDWASLYRTHRLGDLLESCRAQWSRHYDVVLVDCPTGTAGASAICLAQLPDVVVALCPNTTTITDVVSRADAARDRLPYGQPQLTVVPLLPEDGWQHLAADAAGLVHNWINKAVPDSALLRRLSYPAGRPDARAETVAALLARGLAGTRSLVDKPDTYLADARRARLTESDEIRADLTASLVGLDDLALELSSWSDVETALRELWDALDSGDLAELETAAIDLELASTTSRSPDAPSVGAPPAVTLLGRTLRGLLR